MNKTDTGQTKTKVAKGASKPKQTERKRAKQGTEPKQEQNKAQKEYDSEDFLREEIIGVLQEVGLYNKAFAYLVESCVQLVMIRNRAFDALKQDDIVVKEISREGEARLKPNPLCSAYLEVSKELRQVLGELKLTISKSNISDGDALDKLNDKILNIINPST